MFKVTSCSIYTERAHFLLCEPFYHKEIANLIQEGELFAGSTETMSGLLFLIRHWNPIQNRQQFRVILKIKAKNT